MCKGVDMTSKIDKKYIGLVLLIITICENFYYIIDINSFNISGSFSIDDIALCSAITLFIYIHIVKGYGIMNNKSSFKILILLIPILIILSSYAAYKEYWVLAAGSGLLAGR